MKPACESLGYGGRRRESNITNSIHFKELTFKQFQYFLTNRYRALAFLNNKVVSNKTQYNSTVSNNSVVKSVVKFKALHVTITQCACCSDIHKMSSYKKLANQSVDQRRNFV
ncbi:unnamed protein product [Diatraea saccharalis]|uniref:Uncharacterized protein n=1 Tax=Diatraea saccharalis TaxID=40085 RepID=A0A9N9QTI2_9NEOP|nr:unnamed protein product [Diatraea saccharalis]